MQVPLSADSYKAGITHGERPVEVIPVFELT